MRSARTNWKNDKVCCGGIGAGSTGGETGLSKIVMGAIYHAVRRAERTATRFYLNPDGEVSMTEVIPN